MLDILYWVAATHTDIQYERCGSKSVLYRFLYINLKILLSVAIAFN